MIAFLVYYWRIHNFAARVPGYGDVLESLWAIEWFSGGWRDGSGSLLFNPTVFMPEGWSLATFAYGLGMFLPAVPLAALTSAAAAFNVLQLASFFIAYLGMYRLGRLVARRAAAVLAAILYLLWGGRWVRLSGQLNILLGSALLPWLIWFLDRSLTDRQRWQRWALAAGVVWGIMISFSLYFIWIGLFLGGAWLLGAGLSRRGLWREILARAILTSGLAFLSCSPYLWLYWRGRIGTFAYDLHHVASWSLSLNWLPALYPGHPIDALRNLAIRQISGILNESSYVGFGLILLILALFGLVARGRRPAQWTAMLLAAGFGIVLALGPTLHWAGQNLTWPVLRPLNAAIWQTGHSLKPDVFPEAEVPPNFAEAIPLPGLLLAAAVPFFEGARVPARYLMVATPAILLLVAIGFDRLRRPWLQGLLVLLLLVEAGRRPLVGVPFPPPPHPAFVSMATLPLDSSQSILELFAPRLLRAIPRVGGEAIWATLLHGQPIAGGAGSILPDHSAFLIDWFLNHPAPASESTLPWLLRGYGIRYLALHMGHENVSPLSNLAIGTDELRPIGCFDGLEAPPWNYPICLLEVIPAMPEFNVHLTGGWSPAEAWGRWAMGRESRVRWAATNRDEARFAVEAFPYCVDGVPLSGEQQAIEVFSSGRVLLSHHFSGCEPWSGEIVVSSELVDVGWNELRLVFTRADRPVDVTGGSNPDARELSIGFTKLEHIEKIARRLTPPDGKHPSP
jgi:hypothetical protein